MPIYEYDCAACGPFEELRDLRLAGEPVPCPECAGMAPRAFSLSVGVSRGGAAERALRDRVGDAQPRTETRKVHASHAHGGNGRPWMIGH
jgi:putative FmdB family regulatory protein